MRLCSTGSFDARQHRLKAEHLGYQMYWNEYFEDANTWPNKMQTISDEEWNALPMTVQAKYASFSRARIRHIQNLHLDGRNGDEKYQAHRGLKKLITHQDLQDRAEALQRKKIWPQTPNADAEDFNIKQEKNENLTNYNFEQFRDFTKIHTREMELLKKREETVSKMMRYITLNPDNNVSDHFMRQLGISAKDVVDTPDLDISDFSPEQDRRHRRQVIRTRTSRDLSNYESWRVWDRNLEIGNYKRDHASWIKLAPADLVKTFGSPSESASHESTGEYTFEDNQLDLFVIAEYKQTQHYRGYDREDAYYERQESMLHEHKRKPRYPTEEDFWAKEEPVEFKLWCADYAQFRKFKKWIRLAIRDNKEDHGAAMSAKFGHLFPEYKYENDTSSFVNFDPAEIPIFNYSTVDFMDKKAKKNSDFKLPTPARMVNKETAEDVVLTADDIRDMIEESKK